MLESVILVLSNTVVSCIDFYYNFAVAFGSFLFSIKVTLLFLAIVLIRVTVPRLRLETLSRSSWLLGLAFIGFWFTLYTVSWFFL